MLYCREKSKYNYKPPPTKMNFPFAVNAMAVGVIPNEIERFVTPFSRML